MSVTIGAPNEEQKLIMKEYAELVEKMVKIACEYENAFASQNAIARAYESVHWFHSFILNGAKKSVKEGELILNPDSSVMN